MTKSPDVVIVGGGIVGCALARELAGRGAAVTVVDRAQPLALADEISGSGSRDLAPFSIERFSGRVAPRLESASIQGGTAAETGSGPGNV